MNFFYEKKYGVRLVVESTRNTAIIKTYNDDTGTGLHEEIQWPALFLCRSEKSTETSWSSVQH